MNKVQFTLKYPRNSMNFLAELCVIMFALSVISFITGQTINWKAGIVSSEYIFINSTSFASCHASTIAETPEGLVAAWFGGTAEANPDVTIWFSRKQEEGWSTPVEIADGILNETLRYACWNPVLYQFPDNGDLLLFYRVGPTATYTTGWMKRSNDSGITWSAATPLPNGYLGPAKNKPVLLSDGALLCPSSTKSGGRKVWFDVTRDFGYTWDMIGPLHYSNDTDGAEQPSIITYGNDTLQVLCRTEMRSILESWSYDNGQTWTPLRKTTLPNNDSGLDTVSLSDGRKLLVYNHVLPPENETKGDRSPLNVALTYDGQMWYASLVLENKIRPTHETNGLENVEFTRNQYSYPSAIQATDGLVHVVYTWKRLRIKYAVIDPSQLVMHRMPNGIWPLDENDNENENREQ